MRVRVRVRVREGQHRDVSQRGWRCRACLDDVCVCLVYVSALVHLRSGRRKGTEDQGKKRQKRKVCPSEVTTIIPQWWSGPGGLGWLAPSDVEPRQKVVRYGAVRSDS